MDNFLAGLMTIIIALGLIVVYAIIGLLIAIPLYYLWNWLMPIIFGLTTITYWQAWGLYFLSVIILKGSSTYNKNE